MEAELVSHEEEKKAVPYKDVPLRDHLAQLEAQAHLLRTALEERPHVKSEEDLARVDAEVTKRTAHVGNIAMFIHDNVSLGTLGRLG
jgi:hypothetical protein